MDKEEVVKSILTSIDDINTSISCITVDPPSILASKVSVLFERISKLNEVASHMDESSNLQVPLDFFRHIDSLENSNPNTYSTKLIAEGVAASDQIMSRVKYLDNLREKLSAGIDDVVTSDKSNTCI